MIEVIQAVVLVVLLVISVKRSRRILREIAVFERRTRALTAQATAIAVEIERRKETGEKAEKLLVTLKTKIQRLQDDYMAERRRLVQVRRIPPVALWSLDRNPSPTLPLWCVRVAERTDGRNPKSLASVGSGDGEETLPELRPAYVVAAPSGDEAQRQLKARLTSISFDVTDTKPLRTAVAQMTALRRAAGKIA
jgi:hypothetical protein